MAKTSKPAPKKKSAPKASRPAKKAPAKPAAKKPAAKKPAPKKAAAKAPAKKPAAKAPARKPAPKKAPAAKVAAKPIPPPPPAPKPAAPKAAKAARAFRPDELASFRAMLQQQLELVQGNLNALAGDNLKLSPLDSTGDISSHSTHMADHGTDNFDRELALSLASSRQDSIYEIEDAIRRIDEGEYGTCESCGCPIERLRLKALPFAKKCIPCQSAAERGRGRHQPFRSASSVQAMANEDSADSPES